MQKASPFIMLLGFEAVIPGLKAFHALMMNRPREAVTGFLAIDPQGPSVGDWIGYWHYLEQARHLLADHELDIEDARAHGHGEAAGPAIDRAVAWYRSRPAAESATGPPGVSRDAQL